MKHSDASFSWPRGQAPENPLALNVTCRRKNLASVFIGASLSCEKDISILP